jgi:integrase
MARMARPKRRSRGDGSIEQLPSGKWRVRWYTRDGRHPSRTFTVKADAEKYLRRVLVDSERAGTDLAPRAETFASLVETWWLTKEPSLKPRSAERYDLDRRRLLASPLARMSVRDVDYNAVQGYLDGLTAQYAPKTVRGAYNVLCQVVADAQKRGTFTRPVGRAVLPKHRRPTLTVPTRLEVEELAIASDARLAAPVLLCGYCGLREGELLALHTRDVHLDEGWVFVHHARNKSSGALESTKTDRSRRVYLPGRVRAALAEHVDEYPGDLVVPVSASSLQKSWERARATCKLGAVRFHDLRHAAASMMIEAGWNVLQVSRQLGHSTPTQTLNTYGHLWPDSFDEAIRKLDDYIAHP